MAPGQLIDIAWLSPGVLGSNPAAADIFPIGAHIYAVTQFEIDI